MRPVPRTHNIRGTIATPFPSPCCLLLCLSAYNVIAKSRGQLHAVYIITEYAQGGDLLKLLLSTDTPLGWRFRIQIAKEVSLLGLNPVTKSVLFRFAVGKTTTRNEYGRPAFHLWIICRTIISPCSSCAWSVKLVYVPYGIPGLALLFVAFGLHRRVDLRTYFTGSRGAGVLAQSTADPSRHQEQQFFVGRGLALQTERFRHGP